MIAACSWLLDNGSRCRCAATRNQPFCRHHTPEAVERRRARPAARPASDANGEQPNLRVYWPHLRRWIDNEAQLEELPEAVEQLLTTLCAGQISHRCAGQLFAVIAARRQALMAQAQAQQLLALVQSRSSFVPSQTAGPAQVTSPVSLTGQGLPPREQIAENKGFTKTVTVEDAEAVQAELRELLALVESMRNVESMPNSEPPGPAEVI